MAAYLKNKLVTSRSRETKGAETLDRFDFQLVWGLDKLFELHDSGEDYAVGFEFHDDIAVIDSAADPKKIRLYQIKTKSTGKWSVGELLHQGGKSKKNPSIAAKVFHAKTIFPEEADHLGFVSNADADFIDKYPCNILSLPKATYQKFFEQIRSEHPTATDQHIALLHFHKSPFTLENYETHIRGRVAQFVESYCADLEHTHRGFLNALFQQCRKRSKHIAESRTFSELLNGKFISRENMTAWLVALENNARWYPRWASITHSIETYYPAGQLRSIHRDFQSYQSDKLNPSNAALLELRKSARQKLREREEEIETVGEKIEAILPSLSTVREKHAPLLSDNYLRALLLYENAIP